MALTKKVSILGCGWLGKPLAVALVKAGYAVKGSTTTDWKMKDLAAEGIEPFLIHLNPEAEHKVLVPFFDSDILIISIPPGIKRNTSGFHLRQMQFILPFLKKAALQKVIYLSTTSVYPNLNREVVEEDVTQAADAANNTLGIAEDMIRSLDKSWLILRMAGLTGYDRLLIKHFAGKKGLPGGNKPINLIHRNDAVAIISQFIQKEISKSVFNVAAPLHPTKEVFYTFLARKFDFEMPAFIPEGPGKLVSTKKLETILHPLFQYPNPLDFTYTGF